MTDNTLIFATGNPNKVKEVKAILDGHIEVKSMKEIGCTDDIPETSPTLEGNAILKANYLKEHYKVDCFSEDTGLEIESLNGEPGVYSARYGGDNTNANKNMELVLSKLEGIENRKAQFRTVIALIQKGQTHLFEGIVKGHISTEKSGHQGFGYDPIFVPDGYDISFAEMDSNTKNKISHRGQAIRKLTHFLINGPEKQ